MAAAALIVGVGAAIALGAVVLASGSTSSTSAVVPPKTGATGATSSGGSGGYYHGGSSSGGSSGVHGSSGHGGGGTSSAPADPCAGGVINDAQAANLYQQMLKDPTGTITSGKADTLVARLRFLGGSSCSTLADTVQSQIDAYKAIQGSEPPGTYTSTSVGYRPILAR